MNTENFIRFVREFYQTDDFIPLHEPRFIGNEKKYLNDAIDSTFVSSVGEYVNRFECEFADYVGTKFAVATVNGTAALHIALKVAGVSPNTEVITQALTFVATCNAITYCSASPVFVDVDLDTLGLSPVSLRKFLEENTALIKGQCVNKTTGKIISACVPMHTFGHPCRIDEIKEVCSQYNISLVEDSAEALGSSYKEKKLGSFGDLSAFSFNGNKIMTTGGGGMITTDDEELAKKCKYLTTTAKVPHKWEFHHDEIGYNYRMPNLNAALGCAQLENLDYFLKSKRALASKYQSSFSNALKEPPNSKANYWLNAIALKNKKEQHAFLEATNASGIMTRPIWRLMNELPMFSSCQKSDLANSEQLSSTIVNIPSSVSKG